MSITIHTLALEGLKPIVVEVQAQMSPGLPAFVLVGLGDKAIAESRERVRAALFSMGIALPPKKIIINLAPADLQKEGSHYDLPIALALLALMGAIPGDALGEYIVMGELGLDGRIQRVHGILPAAMEAASRGIRLICPAANGSEAAWAGNDIAVAAPDLLALTNHLRGQQHLESPVALPPKENRYVHDLSAVKGQSLAKRALEVAAAGGHNLLMNGPPGAGKSMLASCLPGILPPLNPREMLEVSTIASVAGKLDAQAGLATARPFRDPHHSSSMAAMVGGGKHALPGEISLSHHGVLFLDELPEFQRGVLESMRQPMETGQISIARAQRHVTYPAQFQLIAAMNPCRCGYLTDPARACGKAPRCAETYQSRLSGPLLDRIDLHIEVEALETREMLNIAPGEPSRVVRARVEAARQKQEARAEALGLSGHTNAALRGEEVFEACILSEGAKARMEQALSTFRLSMRAYSRILKMARTLADLEDAARIETHHALEALSYRNVHHIAAEAA